MKPKSKNKRSKKSNSLFAPIKPGVASVLAVAVLATGGALAVHSGFAMKDGQRGHETTLAELKKRCGKEFGRHTHLVRKTPFKFAWKKHTSKKTKARVIADCAKAGVTISKSGDLYDGYLNVYTKAGVDHYLKAERN